MTSASHVDDPFPVAASHVGGIIVVTTSHINATFSVHHVGDDSLSYASLFESMSPMVVNDVGGIEKPVHLRRKPKFLCRNCEGDHLTRLCPATVGIPEVWGSPKGPSNSEASVVSPHHVSLLIDMTLMSLQSYLDHTPVVEGDVSSIPVIMHPLQPKVEEVVVPVQSLVNPTPFLEGDASSNHVFIIPDNAPFEHKRVLLSLSTLPLSLEEVPFDWDGLVGYPMPHPMSFPIRDIILLDLEIFGFSQAYVGHS
jgi:hypothetical protein